MIKKQDGYFKSYDGTRIFYEIRGEGRPLLLCYGIGCLMNHWRHQMRYFSKDHAVITFDYRAHHKSELPSDRKNMTVDSLARDISSLVDHLQLQKVSAWGHSFGAQVLLRAYDTRPDQFENLIFVNGFASNPIEGMFGNNGATNLFNFMKSTYAVAPETLSYLWKLAVNNPIAIQASALLGGFNIHLTQLKDIEIYARGVASMELDTYLRLFESMMEYDGRPVYDKISVPTLIISGQDDNVTPITYQKEMNTKIKTSEFELIPRGSHCTQLDLPDLVNLRIEKFLKENEPKKE